MSKDNTKTAQVDDGGPAFPAVCPTHKLWSPCESLGLSLRDYFAGQALVGLIINPATVCLDAPLSARAYEIADAMLAARARSRK